MIFFLPLGSKSNWDNNETRYLLRSLDKNFKEEFEVIVYTENKIDWLNVKYVEISRYYPDNLLKLYKTKRFENYIDVLNKVYQFVFSPECPENFVFIYDDILLLKEIISKDIINIPQCEYTPEMFPRFQTTRYGKTINQAYNLSHARYNFETHLPRLYNRDKLIQLFHRFPFQEMIIPYSLATLYFNIYPEEAILTPLVKRNDYKVGFEGFTGRIGVFKQDTILDIEKAVTGKMWVNYNDTGLFWMPKKYPLQEWIKTNFKNKSKFEV